MLGLLFPCFWCFLNRGSVLDSLPPLFLFSSEGNMLDFVSLWHQWSWTEGILHEDTRMETEE